MFNGGMNSISHHFSRIQIDFKSTTIRFGQGVDDIQMTAFVFGMQTTIRLVHGVQVKNEKQGDQQNGGNCTAIIFPREFLQDMERHHLDDDPSRI